MPKSSSLVPFLSSKNSAIWAASLTRKLRSLLLVFFSRFWQYHLYHDSFVSGASWPSADSATGTSNFGRRGPHLSRLERDAGAAGDRKPSWPPTPTHPLKFDYFKPNKVYKVSGSAPFIQPLTTLDVRRCISIRHIPPSGRTTATGSNKGICGFPITTSR